MQDATPKSLREAEKDSVDRGFYNIQDGQKGRDGGPYLDHVERQEAEIRRAAKEDREPEDLTGPLPATVGTMQVTAPFVPDNAYSNPSMAEAPGLTVADVDFSDSHLADPLQVLPIDLRTEVPAEDDTTTQSDENEFSLTKEDDD